MDEVILERLDAMQRAQMKSNSRIIRAALVASIASQSAMFMILVNSTGWITAAVGAVIIVVCSLAIKRVAPEEGKREWPSDEVDSYEPYEYRG